MKVGELREASAGVADPSADAGRGIKRNATWKKNGRGCRPIKPTGAQRRIKKPPPPFVTWDGVVPPCLRQLTLRRYATGTDPHPTNPNK
jgi:hypothetical protein